MVRRELETSDVCWLRSEKNAHGAEFELKVSIVLGTRPEIIKMSPVIRECERLDLDYFIIHTGQHYSYNMDRVFFKQLRLPEARHNLDVGSGSHGEQTAKMLIGLEKALQDKELPDVVLARACCSTLLDLFLQNEAPWLLEATCFRDPG